MVGLIELENYPFDAPIADFVMALVDWLATDPTGSGSDDSDSDSD